MLYIYHVCSGPTILVFVFVTFTLLSRCGVVLVPSTVISHIKISIASALRLTFASVRKLLFVSRVLDYSLLQYTKRSVISQLARIHNRLFGETRHPTYLYKQQSLHGVQQFIHKSLTVGHAVLWHQKSQQRKVCSGDASEIEPLCQLFVQTLRLTRRLDSCSKDGENGTGRIARPECGWLMWGDAFLRLPVMALK